MHSCHSFHLITLLFLHKSLKSYIDFFVTQRSFYSEDLKKDHDIKKDYLVNRQIAEWKNTSVIPSVQPPEKMKECRYCKKEFTSKNITTHERRCTQKGEAANAPDVAPQLEGAGSANAGVQGAQGGASNAPLGQEPQDLVPTSKEFSFMCFV